MRISLQIPKTYLIIFFSIFLTDLITKLIAFSILPYNQKISIFGDDFYLYLIFNKEGISGQVHSLINESENFKVYLISSVIGGIIVGSYILLVINLKINILWKILFGIILYFLWFFLFEIFLFNWVNTYDYTPYFISLFRMTGGFYFYFSLFIAIKDKVLKMLILAILSAGFSNIFNHFYYPYYVIDFLYIDIFNKQFGTGIFNFADLVFDLSVLIIICYLAYLMFKVLFKRFI